MKKILILVSVSILALCGRMYGVTTTKCPGQHIGAAPAAAAGPSVPAPNVGALCIPKDGGKDFFALTNKCDQDWLQGGCDRYANTPGYGPSNAKPGYCKKFASLNSMIDYINALEKVGESQQAIKTAAAKTGSKALKMAELFEKKAYESQSALPRFAGLGGSVALCKPHGGKNLFAAPVATSCADQQGQKCACQEDIADPVGCTDFVSDVEKNAYLDKYKSTYGLECNLKSGVSKRNLVPECTLAVKNSFCNPKEGTVKSCGFISNDQNELNKWAGQFLENALVVCKIKATKTTYKVPAADCSEETQRQVCSDKEEEPVFKACKQYKDPKKMGFALGKVPS